MSKLAESIEKEVAELKAAMERKIAEAENAKLNIEAVVEKTPKWRLMLYVAGAVVVLTTVLIGMCSKTGTVI